MAQISLSPRSGALNNKEHALMYVGIGWRVFPCFEITAEGVCACSAGAACDRPGKHPRVKNWQEEASSSRNDAEAWWTRWPGASVGIATGKTSNLTVVDADASEGKPGVNNLTEMSAKHGGIPATLVANTGGGGLHLYFRWTERFGTGTNVLGEAIDCRSDGGYVIAPPSLHKSGKRYAWRADKGELLEVPEWMVPARAEAKASRRRGRPRTRAGAKIERLQDMLAVIDPNDRDTWLKVGIILGRLYVGTVEENDAWALYEEWSARSEKFDDDKAANLVRMREAYNETSQAETPRGGTPLGLGSLIHWARAAGWKPFGDRVVVDYEPGNESLMAEALVAALTGAEDNHFFNVMGEIRDVLKTTQPVTRLLQRAAERGETPPETLVVRQTTGPSIADAVSRVAVLATTSKDGAPAAVPVPPGLVAMVLAQHAVRFPPLTGVAEWPMVGEDGSLIMREHGYDPSTGLYFDIDRALRIDESMTAEDGWSWIRQELLADFPFEDEVSEAGALGLLIAFMQRPLMKTCPAFAVTAPQPGSGKSTLVEVASMAVHGFPMASHAFSDEEEELRKAIHSLLMAKIPAVMFDNITRGRALASDHIAKLISSEVSTDRKLGASDTRKEVNTLLVTFTGNNIAFVRDLASRVATIRLNAKTVNPLRRKFRHRDVKSWAAGERGRTLGALIACVRAGLASTMEDGPGSRFEDFDAQVVRPVLAVTGVDVRRLLDSDAESDSEADDAARAALGLIGRWQQEWRDAANGQPWRIGELAEAIDAKVLDEAGVKVLRRWVENAKLWDLDHAKALSYALRNVAGDHKFEPLVLTSRLDAKAKVNKWHVDGTGEKSVGGTGF